MMYSQFFWLAALVLVGLEVAGAPALAQAGPRGQAVPAGVVADGKTDNTVALQKALDAAGTAGGGIVNLPAGRLRIDASACESVHWE